MGDQYFGTWDSSYITSTTNRRFHHTSKHVICRSIRASSFSRLLSPQLCGQHRYPCFSSILLDTSNRQSGGHTRWTSLSGCGYVRTPLGKVVTRMIISHVPTQRPDHTALTVLRLHAILVPTSPAARSVQHCLRLRSEEEAM